MTNVAMADALDSLDLVEGIDDVKIDVSVKSPAAAAPASRRKVLRETSNVEHVYNTRRSSRLAGKIKEPKEKSKAIKIISFIEENDEIVEVKMKEGSVDESEISEITVLDNIKECSEESEVKSNDQSKAIPEEKSGFRNGENVAVASIDHRVASDIKTIIDLEGDGSIDGTLKEEDDVVETIPEVDEVIIGSEVVHENNVSEEVCGMKTEGLIEDTEMDSNAVDESEAFIEDTKMNANEEVDVNPSFEDTATSSTEDEEIVAVASIDHRVASDFKTIIDLERDGPIDGTQKEEDDVVETIPEVDEVRIGSEVVHENNVSEEVCGMDSNAVDESEAFIEDTKMNANEEVDVNPSFEDTATSSKEDEEIVVAELKVADSCNAENEHQFNHAYVEEIENDGDMVATDTVNIQETDDEESDDDKSDMPEKDETSDDEESDISNCDCQEVCVPGFEICVSLNIQETDEEESDMPDKNETSDDEESDIPHGDYQEENCLPEVEIEDDNGKDKLVVANVTVNTQETDKEESDIPDENESSDDEDPDMSDDDYQTEICVPFLSDDDYQTEIQEDHTKDELADKDNLESGMVANVTVTIQKTNNEESVMSDENETLDDGESVMSNDEHQEDIFVSDVEIHDDLGKDEQVNFVDDDLVSSVEPLKKSANRTPKSLGRYTWISEDKENADSGRKSALSENGKPKKKPLDVMGNLSNMFKDLVISKPPKKQEGNEEEGIISKATSTRPALKTLPNNCMGVESKN